MILVTGGSSSGKSAYAEQLLTEIKNENTGYYIATMKVWDEESRARVKKHRGLREGKGFSTIEQPKDILRALDQIAPGSCVLLECMSNLVANEMFDGEEMHSAREVADKILRQTVTLDGSVDQLIVVTNNVFEDGTGYDPSTVEYLRALGDINCRLAELANQVVEVVAGIPVALK